MTAVLYLAPIEGSGTIQTLPPDSSGRKRKFNNCFRPKYVDDSPSWGMLRTSRRRCMALARSGDPQYFADLASRDDVTILSVGDLDAQLSSATVVGQWVDIFQDHGLPSHWLASQGLSLTVRQVAYVFAALALFGQRYEAEYGISAREGLERKGKGRNRQARLFGLMNSSLSAAPAALRSEVTDCLTTLKCWKDYQPNSNDKLQDVLLKAAARHGEIIIGRERLGLSNPDPVAGMTMVYGDRNSIATDDFSDDPFTARWTNSPGIYGDMEWAGTDYVRSADNNTSGMVRDNGETFDDDQYSTVTIQGHNDFGSEYVGGSVRGNTTDSACYIGTCDTDGTDEYRVYELDSSLNFTSLDTDAWAGAALANGETITCEAEGTTIRMGTAEGGADTERSSGTDATITGGEPGIHAEDSFTDDIQIDGWEGGDVTIVSSDGILGGSRRGIMGGFLRGVV